MTDSVRSMVLGPSILYLVAIAAIVLTVTRRAATPPPRAIDELIGLYVVGISLQCLHVLEEYLTGFQTSAPQFLGLVPWPDEFFIVFNLIWISLWVLSIAGLQSNRRIAFFPIWFFAIGMVGNAVWHPLLSLATGGYFPGLLTSPLAGIVGVQLLDRLWRLTAAERLGPM